MYTNRTSNKQNSYSLLKPNYKTKESLPKITNYALLLLYVWQHNKMDFRKVEIVETSLPQHKGKFGTVWSQGSFCNEFAAFNHNQLLDYNPHSKRWNIGPNLEAYLVYHFSNVLDLNDCPYDQAQKLNNVDRDIFFQVA